MLKSYDIAKHVSTDGQSLEKIELLNSMALEMFWSFNFIGYRSDCLLILLVIGLDDLSYRQENIRSKFNKCVRIFSGAHNFIGGGIMRGCRVLDSSRTHGGGKTNLLLPPFFSQPGYSEWKQFGVFTVAVSTKVSLSTSLKWVDFVI